MEYELFHWGIKGQKWGVRRFQNEDGTLTEAGKKRYSEVRSVGDGIYLAKTKSSPIAKALSKISPKIAEEQKKTNISDILVDGKTIGEVQTFLESKGSLNVVWIGVDEKERGKKYAQKVLDHVIKTAKADGMKQITLEVPGNSPDARHIYEKKGFVPGEQVTSVEDDPVWGGLTRMTKKL